MVTPAVANAIASPFPAWPAKSTMMSLDATPEFFIAGPASTWIVPYSADVNGRSKPPEASSNTPTDRVKLCPSAVPTIGAIGRIGGWSTSAPAASSGQAASRARRASVARMRPPARSVPRRLPATLDWPATRRR